MLVLSLFTLLYALPQSSTSAALNGIRNGFTNPPNCKPISRTASTVKQLAAQGILQATKKGIPPTPFHSTLWGWAAPFTKYTNTFARGYTPLELTNKAGDGGHEGVDQEIPTGSPLFAIADGRIAYILTGCIQGDKYCGNAWGNMVVIDHGNSRFSRYAHISSVQVTLWQQVKQGDVIAFSGSTGLSKGPHLHLEIGLGLKRLNGKAVSNFFVLNGQDIIDPCAAPPVFETVFDYEKLPY